MNDPNVDLIDICLPPYLHTEVAIRAFENGKHVICEKPMALSIDECDQIMQAAAKSDRQALVGHVLPFFPEYAYVKNLVGRRSYGKLLGGEFKRTISDPSWLADFYRPDKVGGPLIDLHVHDAHFIRMLFGMPDAVHSVGRTRDEVVEYCATLFEYPDSNYVVSCISGVINQQGRPFAQGFEIHLENATVQFEFGGFVDQGESMPLKVLTDDGQVVRPELGDGDPVAAFVIELSEVIDIVSGQRPSSGVLDAKLARDAIELCHLQSQSVFQRARIPVESAG